MTDDIIERAEALLDDGETNPSVIIRQLLAALKTARAENRRLQAHLPILDPNCPSCECGGQLCSEHGTGIDRR